jgi:uncharacterized protein
VRLKRAGRSGPARLGRMRVEIHVRPNASTAAVGGEFDGALVVRVTEPAVDGRATDAVLAAVSASVCVPRRTITLVRRGRSRRKLLEIDVGPGDVARVERVVARLRDDPRG